MLLNERHPNHIQAEDDNSNDEPWDNIDDYSLFEGISKYGMEEWDRIIRDSEIWDHSEPKTFDDRNVWKLIFKKVENKEPPADQEQEGFL